jgi:hypothetical protein
MRMPAIAQFAEGTHFDAMALEVVLMLDFDILTTTRSWVATPWVYNSCIGLRFRADGSGDMVFGYGQTIHAKINFRFSLRTTNELTLIYQDSPGDRFVKSFTPSESGKSKAVQYSLKEGEITGVAANSGPFKYYWTLSLDKSPFPDEAILGHVRPRHEYYGHHVNETTRSGRR